MPDHLHGILFVKEKMEKPLGMALRGFKQSCNRHYREVFQYVALATQQTRQPQQPKHDRRGEDRSHGLLFARGYNDKLLLRAGQLDTWLRYLADNPRRLLMKREHPDLFRVQRNVQAAGITFSAIGNRFLLDRPVRLQVQCSRSSRMEACANGQLLILAPWEHHNEQIAIRRGQCLALNDIARHLCESGRVGG